jgi:hypothetical protein
VIEKTGYRPNLKKAGDKSQLVPPQSWEGWELMCFIIPVAGDNHPFVMRQAVKMVVAADESNLTGGHVDWAAVEATLEATTTGTMPENQFPTTQQEEEMYHPSSQPPSLAVILYHEVSQPKTKKRGGHRGKNKKVGPVYSYAVALPGQSVDEAEWMTEEELIKAFPETWKLILVEFKKKGGEVGIDLGPMEEEEEEVVVVVQEEDQQEKGKKSVDTLQEEVTPEENKTTSARKGRPPKIKPRQEQQQQQQELKSAAAVKAIPQLSEPSKQKAAKEVVAPLQPLEAIEVAAPIEAGGVSLQNFNKQLEHVHSPANRTRQQQPLSAPPAERPAQPPPQQQQRRVSEAPPPVQSLLTSASKNTKNAQVMGQLRALSLKKLPNSPGYAHGANLSSIVRRPEGMTSSSSCQRPIIEVAGVRVKYTVVGHLASLDMFNWKASTKAVLEGFKMKEADEMAGGYAAYKKIAQQSISVEKKEPPMVVVAAAGGGRQKRKQRSPPSPVVPLSDDDDFSQQPANKKQKVQHEQHKPRRSARLAPEDEEEEEEEEEFVDAQEELLELVDIAIKEGAHNPKRLTRAQAAAAEQEEEEMKTQMKNNNTRQTRSRAAEIEEEEEEEDMEEKDVKKFLITEEHIVNPDLWDSARITGAIHKDDELFVFIKWGVDGHTDIVDSTRLMGDDRPHSMRALIEFYESRSRKKKTMKKRRQQRRRE